MSGHGPATQPLVIEILTRQLSEMRLLVDFIHTCKRGGQCLPAGFQGIGTQNFPIEHSSAEAETEIA